LEIDRATHERVAGRIADELGTDGPLFGVHPGNKNSAYNWPEPHYAQLIGRLARHGRVMVTGSAEERSLLERIGGQLTEGATGRIGFFANFQLIELASALSQQTSLTVSSTGPMHVAAVVGTPVVGLFSPHPVHSPNKWAPLGAGHTLLVAPLEAGEDPRVGQEKAALVMARISVDRVLDANLNYAERALMAVEESKQ
jgi:ADP-heptose:LPS heptosyltransferase